MQSEPIPDEVMEIAFHLTAGDWNQPHDVRATKVAVALFARDKRAAEIARRRIVGGYLHGTPEWADGDSIAAAILTYEEADQP